MKKKIAAGILLVGLLAGGATWAWAQALGVERFDAPTILSGSDFGFRVEGHRGDVVVGKLVVKVDGKWVETQIAPGTSRITLR